MCVECSYVLCSALLSYIWNKNVNDFSYMPVQSEWT